MKQSNELRDDARMEELKSLLARVDEVRRPTVVRFLNRYTFWAIWIGILGSGLSAFWMKDAKIFGVTLIEFWEALITSGLAWVMAALWDDVHQVRRSTRRYVDLQTHVDSILLKEVLAIRQRREASVNVWAENALRTNPAAEVDPVVQRAAEVIGDREEAFRWLGTPVRALGYATPMSLLATAEGRDQVLSTLDRLEHGIL